MNLEGVWVSNMPDKQICNQPPLKLQVELTMLGFGS